MQMLALVSICQCSIGVPLFDPHPNSWPGDYHFAGMRGLCNRSALGRMYGSTCESLDGIAGGTPPLLKGVQQVWLHSIGYDLPTSIRISDTACLPGLGGPGLAPSSPTEEFAASPALCGSCHRLPPRSGGRHVFPGAPGLCPAGMAKHFKQTAFVPTWLPPL